MKLQKIQTSLFATFAALAIIYAAAVPFTNYQPPTFEAVEILGTTSVLPVAPDIVPALKKSAVAFESKAYAALAYDLESKTVLYNQNSDLPWPTASLAKMMTAIMALNLQELEDVVTIAEEDLNVSNPKMGLVPGEQISVKALLSGMLIASANDAAYALARGATGSQQQFVGLMNEQAKRFSMLDTQFSDPAGFDSANQHSTAFDILTLTLAFLQHPELSEIATIKSARVSSTDGSRNHWLATTNKLLEEGRALGVKTGYTDLAQGNLVSLFEDAGKHKIITIILGSGQREQDSLELSDWVFDSYNFQEI